VFMYLIIAKIVIFAKTQFYRLMECNEKYLMDYNCRYQVDIPRRDLRPSCLGWKNFNYFNESAFKKTACEVSRYQNIVKLICSVKFFCKLRS